MTEGTCELAFMNALLEKGLLKINRRQLLGEQIFHLRQIKGEAEVLIQSIKNNDVVDIFRVGDKLNDKLKLPKTILASKIETVKDYCILPEFEILLLLHENLYEAFLKNKSKSKPSEFYKSSHRDYNKQYKYVYDYFFKLCEQEIIDIIHLYNKKRQKSHNKNQHLVSELLKENDSF